MLKHQETKVFTSIDMRKKWPKAAINFLEKLIEYVPNVDQNMRTVEMTSATNAQIGKAIQVLCKI